MASSSSSRVCVPQKVCVVCYRVAVGWSEYWIYIVDLNIAAGDFFSRRDPTFRIKDDDSFSSPCFCVLGPTLYLFQGYERDSKTDTFVSYGKTVYTHPLPSSDTANLTLTWSTMSVAKAPLQDVKFWPTAVPTPDGKQILVVSTGFRRLRKDWICAFELYDPSRQTSTVIRAFPLERSFQRVFSVKFIGPRTVLLRTTKDRGDTGCLILDDLHGGDPKWADDWEWSRNIERLGIGDSFLFRQGWCFKGWTAYDIGGHLDLRGQRRDYEYPASSATNNYDITPLQGDDLLGASFCCCTLRMGRTLRPFVMLDVYKFDFEEVGSRVVAEEEEEEMMMRLRGMEIVKSIRFYDAEQLGEFDCFSSTKTFFSIPTTACNN